MFIHGLVVKRKVSMEVTLSRMITLLLVVSLTILAEFLTITLINRREVALGLDWKKQGIVLGVGNLFLMALSWYKQTQGGLSAWWYFGLFTYLLCLTLYDLKFRELPDWWHLFPLTFYAVGCFFGKQPVEIYESAMVTIVLAAVLGLIFLLKKDAIGLGDIKLLLVCGIYAGSACVSFLIHGMILAFFFSIGLLLLKKATAKSELPFVPFLLLGALLM